MRMGYILIGTFIGSLASFGIAALAAGRALTKRDWL